MTNRETLYELISEVKSSNIDYKRISFLMKIVEEDLEVLEELEILKKYYSPFKKFLEEMFKKGYNDDLTKVKDWLENERISEN